MPTQTIFSFTKSKIASLEYAPGSSFLASDLASIFKAPQAMLQDVFLQLAQHKIIHITSPEAAVIAHINLTTTANSIFIIKSLLTAIITEANPAHIKKDNGIAQLQAHLSQYKDKPISSSDFFKLTNEFYFALSQLFNFQRVTNIIFAENFHIERILRLTLKCQTDYLAMICLYAKIAENLNAAQFARAITAVCEFASTLEEHTLLAKMNHSVFFEDEKKYQQAILSPQHL